MTLFKLLLSLEANRAICWPFTDEGLERQSRHKNSLSAYEVTRRFKTNNCYEFVSHLACSWLLETDFQILSTVRRLEISTWANIKARSAVFWSVNDIS